MNAIHISSRPHCDMTLSCLKVKTCSVRSLKKKLQTTNAQLREQILNFQYS